MKDELWLKRIQRRLDDYSEPLPAGGWERLEKELPGRSTARRPTLVPRRWQRWAVAAVLAGVLVLTGVYMLDREVPHSLPSDDLARSTNNVEADPLPVPVAPAERLAEALPTAYPPAPIRHPASQATTPEPTEDKTRERLTQAQEKGERLPTGERETTREPATERPRKQKSTTLPDANGGLLAQSEPVRRPSAWMLGISVGNSALSGNAAGRGEMRPTAQSAPGTGVTNLDLPATSNGLISIPDGQELIFKNGVPYLQSRRKAVISATHRQPVSVGVSVRKNLPRHFSVETGLVYTYLSSELLYENAAAYVDQRLHYLGIPLRANWSFVDKTRFQLYLSAGGMMEKCVYGKTGSATTTVGPLQWSVMASVGAQYNLSKRVGIYVEPGLSYYFDDGSDVMTIRKDNPCNFTLQAGMRLSY